MMMTAEITDDALMAFVDGELTGAERERVEAALESDPELRARLLVFERTGRALGDLYEQPIKEPVPDHLVDLVRNAKVGGRERAETGGLLERLKESFAGMILPQPGFAAASAAALLAVGVSLGVLLEGSAPELGAGRSAALLSVERNHIWADGALRQALEGVQSGEAQAWSGNGAGEGTVVPVLTFKDKTGRFCREYAVTGAPEARAVGIACRGEDARWSIEIHTAETQESQGFRPASSTGIERLSALMQEMSAGEPLDLDQEEAAIGVGWK